MIELDEKPRQADNRHIMAALLHRSVPARDWERESFNVNGAQSEAVHARLQRNGSTANDPWEMVIDEVVAVQRLGDNWDGLGAKAPARELLAAAVGLAYLIKDRGTEPPKAAAHALDLESHTAYLH